MCWLSACQDVVIRISSKTFIMAVSVPTQLCPHAGRHSYAHLDVVWTPTILFKPSLFVSTAVKPLTIYFLLWWSLCYAWMTLMVSVLVMVSSDVPVIHFRTTDGSSLAWLSLFLLPSQFANSAPSGHFVKLLPLKADIGTFKSSEGKAMGFILFLHVVLVPKRLTGVCICRHSKFDRWRTYKQINGRIQEKKLRNKSHNYIVHG